MYYVINIAHPPTEVYIEDLDFKLGPNKALDLGSIYPQNILDQSKDLIRLSKARKIQLRIGKQKSIEVREPKPSPVSNGLNETDIKKITDAVVEKISTIAVVSQASLEQQKTGLSQDQLSLILKEIQSLKENPSSGHTVSQARTDEEPSGIDFETLSNIHAKSVNRLSKNDLNSSVSYEEKQSEDKTSSIADELGDLLS